MNQATQGGERGALPNGPALTMREIGASDRKFHRGLHHGKRECVQVTRPPRMRHWAWGRSAASGPAGPQSISIPCLALPWSSSKQQSGRSSEPRRDCAMHTQGPRRRRARNLRNSIFGLPAYLVPPQDADYRDDVERRGKSRWQAEGLARTIGRRTILCVVGVLQLSRPKIYCQDDLLLIRNPLPLPHTPAYMYGSTNSL